MAKRNNSSAWIGRCKQMASTALACAAAALITACGGGGSAESAASDTPPANTAKPQAHELKASESGELLSYVKTKIKEGAADINILWGDTLVGTTMATTAASANAAPAFSGTRLQELGVDEADLVKTDGKMIYALTSTYWNGTTTVPASLQAQERQADGQLVAKSRLELGKSNSTGMYLASNAGRIALLGQNYGFALTPLAASTSVLPNPHSMTSQIDLDVVSVSVPGTMTMAQRVRIDGQLVGSRMINNSLYIVSSWSPALSSFAFPATATVADKDARLASLSTKNLLPNLQINGGAVEPLLADTDCYLQATNAAVGVQMTIITAFDLSTSSLQRNSRCFMGGSEGLYMSQSNVYLTSSRYYSFDTTANLSTREYKSETTTDIHKFSLQGQTIAYKGSGTVPGHLGWDKDKLAYRMSEYQGDLRVLSFTGSIGWGFPMPMPMPAVLIDSIALSSTSTATASPATLTILREVSGKGLQAIGSLPNSQRPAALGKPGEQVYAVQFVGPRAYVVTFRQVDPLYVIDVSNPADPKALGELEMPGFSDYLYPMGENLLLGVGKDASATGILGGVKVALMDIANPARPSIVNSVVLGQRGSNSTLDDNSHGINILKQGNTYRIALPVRVHQTPSAASGTVQAWYEPTYQGLHRFEVDTAAKTLVSQPAIKSIEYGIKNAYSLAYSQFNIANDRSVQIASQVYYFSGASFISANW
jgi:uncharacterized secreted protein with C-terminal beta-propeller domain